MHRIDTLLAFALTATLAACSNTANEGGAGAPDLLNAVAPVLDLAAPATKPDLAGSGGGAADLSTAPSGDAGGADASLSPMGGNSCNAPTSITVTPAGQTAMVTIGTPYSQAFTAVAHYQNGPDADVTKSAFFAVSDVTLGSMAGDLFTWAGTHGGPTEVSATLCGTTGSTTLTLALMSNEGKGGADPNQSAMKFQNATPTQTTSCNPTLVYPPDGVLLPPNTNVIEVHFLRGSPANNLFQISFSNGITNVNLYTTCSGNTPADGMLMNGGCIVELSQADWSWLASTNRDGNPVQVTVKGVGCDGNNVGTSATRSISFAKDDLVGTLYYWASLAITQNGTPVNSGGIFRYDFGLRGQLPDPVLTPSSSANPTGLCIGCHDISRDGRKMIFLFDDNDDDDEYGDVRTDIYDIAAQTAAVGIQKNGNNSFSPGYHTWNRETSEFLLTDGLDKNNPAGAFYRVSATGTVNGTAQSGALRATTPDFAPDDSMVVFAAPPNVSSTPPAAGWWLMASDLWFAGASLYVAPWDPVKKTLGTATTLVPSQNGGNYYYPSYSPEGSFLAFNYAASGANFHNANARVQIVSANQGNPKPVDLAKLNDKGALTNSWARWAPFVQDYQGGKILWITFSSTRDYGLRIENENKVNCLPRESPNNVGPFFDSTPNCTRAQIWMAAIKLDENGVMMGVDPSLPAFWLPFQDLGTNNHLAQWAQRSFSGTCKMDPDCNANGMTGRCCVNGGCTACAAPPPPPPPQCTVDANCARGLCCLNKACVACPADGGTPPPDGGSPPAPDAGPPPAGCNTCIDCNGQACIAGTCGACTNSAQCCAPLVCFQGECIQPVQ